MISFLRNWCEGIIICVFISLIIEMLVPNGNIKKYVKVIVGIYIVFVILNPILSNIDNIKANSFFDFETNYNLQSFENTTAKMINIYGKSIEENIKEKCIGVERVKVTFSNDLEGIEKIEIVVNEDAKIDDIRKYVKENYNVLDDTALSCIVGGQNV